MMMMMIIIIIIIIIIINVNVIIIIKFVCEATNSLGGRQSAARYSLVRSSSETTLKNDANDDSWTLEPAVKPVPE